MQISSLIDIIGGRLLNSPSISFIYSFKTDPTKVKEGDVFIAKDLDDVENAVKNGAFAIIIENFYPIIDNEIAWIKVDSIEKSLIHLIRYKLAHFNLEAYYCDKISYDLLNIFAVNSSKNIRFISNDLETFIKEFDDIKDDDIIISTNKSILDKLYPNNKNFNSKVFEIKNLTEHSLFEVSFSFDDIYFQRVRLSSIYIPQLIATKDFLDIELDLSRLKSFNHLKPLFLDKTNDLTDFGKSEKFVLVQNNVELIEDEIKYIKSRYKYAKTIFITTSYIKILGENQIILENIDSLKDLLKENTFNAAYLIGLNYNEVFLYLTKLEEENTLF